MIRVGSPHPTAARSFRALLAWGSALVTAAVVAAYSVQQSTEGIAFALLVLVASIVFMRNRETASTISFRWVPVAWVAMVFTADHHFFDLIRSPLEAAYGSASPENIVQVAVFAMVGAMVLRSRRTLVQLAPSKIPKLPMLLFPALALASVLWSPIKLFTAIRASQLLVITALSLLTVRVWHWSPRLGKSIWRDTLSLFVQLATALVLVGFIVGWTGYRRFHWPGIEPGLASTWAGAALLILLVGGKRFAPRPVWAYWARVAILATAVFLGETRTVLAAIPFAGLVAVWTLGREKPIARYLGLWYYAVAALLLVLLARLQLAAYLSRGESSQSLDSLSGRIPLWHSAIHDLDAAGKMYTGFGYGAARIVLYPQYSWAGTAHNSWIEALLGVGIVGVCFLAAAVMFLVWRLGWGSESNRFTRLALALLAFLLVVSLTSEIMATPGIGFALLAWIFVPALGQWKRFPDVPIRPEGGSSVTTGGPAVARTVR
ncbi:MAG: O-antigen ligase family protein [Actinomycetota bacterium]|nr:O-antigen ligase family protein [Actinomycetota bacterium]